MLAVLSLPAVAYAWSWYSEWRRYPPSVRAHLLNAITATNNQDFRQAEQEYRLALQECKAVGLPETSLEYYAIAMQLAYLYEFTGRLDEACEQYVRVWFSALPDPLRTFSAESLSKVDVDEASAEEARRLGMAVGTASRLGDMLVRVQNYEGAQVMYEWTVKLMLGYSEAPGTVVKRLLKTFEDPGAFDFSDILSGQTETLQHDSQDIFVPDETSTLPKTIASHLRPVSWVSAEALGAALEVLGDAYAMMDMHEAAMAVHFRALQILRDDVTMALSQSEKDCRTAVLSNNIANSFAGIQQLADAKQWATKALESADASGRGCEECRVVVLHNLGRLYEMEGNLKQATKLFNRARELAADMKFLEGVRVAREGLLRVQALSNNAKNEKEQSMEAPKRKE
ncbi:hypothetical protein HK102_012489 [Quaeritorhiza haematococci]|nr:hypothetical protein HK102_012489 [Quaeritorhiza haematococci]